VSFYGEGVVGNLTPLSETCAHLEDDKKKKSSHLAGVVKLL
jgi:hypothetical protein